MSPRRALRRLWSEARHRWTALFGGRRLERELNEELAFHLEMETAEELRRGQEPAAARRRARVSFGGVERAKEQCREARGTAGLQNLLRDLGFGVRLARREAGFSAVVVLTLALGIGATTGIYSVARAVLLAPLPYPEPEELVLVHNRWSETPRGPLSETELMDYEEELTGDGGVFSHLGAWVTGPANVTGGTAVDPRPEQVRGAFASPGLFGALGVEAALGRTFRAAEGRPGAEPVGLVGWDLWQRRFGGSREVLGREVRLDGRPVVLVGILPPDFRLPGDFAAGPTELVLPLVSDPADHAERGGHYLGAVGRLRPGIGPEAADRAVAAVAAAMVRRYPAEYPDAMGFTGGALPLHQAVVEDSRTTLWLLLAAAALVLLVACANVAALMLARGRRRNREMALRAALGARRGRLVCQVLAESLVLASAGGAVGLGLAAAVVEAVRRHQPPGLPRVDEVALDPGVLLFTTGVTLASSLAFGLLPALRTGWRRHGADNAVAGGSPASGHRTTTAGPAEGRASTLLVVAEVALALLLLVTAGLLGRSLLALHGVDPGFEPSGVVAVDLSLPGGEWSPDGVIRFYDQLSREVTGAPGVEAAGAVSFLPLASSRGDVSFEIEGRPTPHGQAERTADWQVVTPGYFEAAGLRLRRGRFLTEGDREDGPGAVLVNRTLAEAYWPEGDALGARLRLLGGTGPESATVVGVLEDVKNLGLDAEPQREIFFAHRQFRFWHMPIPTYDMTLVARGPEPGVLRDAIEAEVARQAPDVPVSRFRTLEEVVGRSLARERFTATVVGSFTLLTLLVATVGVYGLLAYAVEARRREIGIRRVLGAGVRPILRMTVGRGLAVVAVGAAVGLVAAVLAGRLLDRLLFGVTAGDPATYLLALAALFTATLVATGFPARRALAVDPAAELRGE